MTTVKEALESYNLTDYHSQAYRLAEDNLAFFYDTETIKRHQVLLDSYAVGVHADLRPLIGFAIERFLESPLPHNGEPLSADALQELFVVFYRRYNPGASWDVASGPWARTEPYQLSLLSEVISRQYRKLLPSHTIAGSFHVVAEEEIYLTVSNLYCYTTVNQLLNGSIKALNTYASEVSRASYYSEFIQFPKVGQLHESINKTPGSPPIVLGSPFQAHAALNAFKHVWNAIKLGLALPPFSRADLDNIKVYGSMLELMLLRLTAARGVDRFIPANDPPLIPQAIRHVIARHCNDHNLSKVMFKLRCIAKTAPASSYHTEHPASFLECSVIPPHIVDPLLIAVMAPQSRSPPSAQKLKKPNTDEGDVELLRYLSEELIPALEQEVRDAELVESVGSMAIDLPDPWTEEISFLDACRLGLFRASRDANLSRGIHKLLTSEPREGRMGIWEMRVGACSSNRGSGAVALSVPACKPAHIPSAKLEPRSVGILKVLVIECMQKVASGIPDSDEVRQAAAILRGVSQARGICVE